MKLNYKTNTEGISVNSYSSCEDFVVGDSIICMDDKCTMNITKNQTYEALYIYEADSPSSETQTMFVQIADDGNEICGYEVNRFTSIHEHREQQLSKILDN